MREEKYSPVEVGPAGGGWFYRFFHSLGIRPMWT